MILFKTHKDIDTTIEAATSAIIDTQQASLVGFQVNATVNSTAKAAACAIPSSVVTQGLTLTAVLAADGEGGVASNSITIAFTSGGTAGAEVVTVVAKAISVKIASGTSTVTQVRTAMQAAAACTALVTTTGTSAATVAAAVAVTLTGGADSHIDIDTGVISISSHGFYTGLVVQATKSGSAFPTGMLATTNYYVKVIDVDTIQLFDTLAHALAAVLDSIDIDDTAYFLNKNYSTSTGVAVYTTDGSLSSTITFTPTAISGVSYKLQRSADYDPRTSEGNWVDAVAGESNTVVTNNITVSANTVATIINNCWPFVRILFAISAGTIAIKVISNTKTR